MATALDGGDDFVWTPELASFDPSCWPGGRAEWHLARCKAAPDKLTTFNEIRAASQRLWLHDPEAYRALGYA